MNTEFFVKLANPVNRAGGSVLDELKVSIDHEKGGYSYFSGDIIESGVKVYFTPIHRESGMYTTTMLGKTIESGFKVHVLDAQRKSQKKIDNVAKAIEPLLDKFGELWGSDNFNYVIFDMVKAAVAPLAK